MTPLFSEDEEDELLLADSTGTEIDELEITLDDVEELEEEENIGHKVQTFNPDDDGTDNYFDEKYFDE